MKKIYTKIMDGLASIGLDKIVHFLACFVITLIIAMLLTANYTMKQEVIIALSFGATFLIGIFKELADNCWRGGGFSLADLLADFLGSIAGVIITVLLVL